MDALELILLGRRLTKIGEEALRGSSESWLPNGPTLVLRDVFANPDSTIGEISARTTLPQSYVSESVAGLDKQGLLETRIDPADRRRTRVRVSEQHLRTIAQKGSAPVDGALSAALQDAGDATALIDALQTVASRLRTAPAGPIVAQINRSRRQPPRDVA